MALTRQWGGVRPYPDDIHGIVAEMVSMCSWVRHCWPISLELDKLVFRLLVLNKVSSISWES